MAPPRQQDIDASNAGRRLDTVVRQLCPGIPLGVLMRWMRTGVVRLNGRRAKPPTRLVHGDRVALPALPAAPVRPCSRLPPIDVVYEDEALLVVSKPAGLPCHAGTKHTHDSLAARVVAHLGAENAPVGHRPGLAQRLDKDVSGLIVAGKNAAALRRLAVDVSTHRCDKVYLALVDGSLAGADGCIDLPLRVDDEPMGDRPRTHPDSAGKKALTFFRVVDRRRDATLVEVWLRTGRTHQIRAHMRAIGHPILGDPRYAQRRTNDFVRSTYGLQRLFLHASRLELVHPVHATPLSVTARLPSALQRVFDALP